MALTIYEANKIKIYEGTKSTGFSHIYNKKIFHRIKRT